MDRGFSYGTVSFRRADGGEAALALAVPDDAGDDLTRALREGRHQPTPSARLVLQLAPGRRLFDLGAHLGTVALPAAALGAHVVAVEPSPRNFAALERSVARQGRDVQLLHAAVSDAPGVLHLIEDGPFTRVAATAGDGTVPVPTLTLGDVLDRAGWAPDLVKIDVEGYELEVLAGLETIIAAAPRPPDVVVESNGHVLRLRGRSPRALVARLAGLGYRVFLIGDGRLTAMGESDVQPETVVDLFATTRATLPWPHASALSPRTVAGRLADELHHANRWHRAWAAAELRTAPPRLLRHRRLRAALTDAVRDADEEVRAAAAWWTERPPEQPGRLWRRR